jgi:nucleotide exchange factor SIL1
MFSKSEYSSSDNVVSVLQDIERVRKSFRSYETLKKDFEALELAVKTDLELLNELLMRFKAGGDDQKLLSILTDLEYLVHQFDNAQEFAKMGG